VRVVTGLTESRIASQSYQYKNLCLLSASFSCAVHENEASAKIKNEWSHTFTRPVWLHDMHWDTYTFTFTFTFDIWSKGWKARRTKLSAVSLSTFCVIVSGPTPFQKMYHFTCTEPLVIDNSSVHKSFQNCGSSVWKLLFDTELGFFL
jgi:hypothetical protein